MVPSNSRFYRITIKVQEAADSSPNMYQQLLTHCPECSSSCWHIAKNAPAVADAQKLTSSYWLIAKNVPLAAELLYGCDFTGSCSYLTITEVSPLREDQKLHYFLGARAKKQSRDKIAKKPKNYHLVFKILECFTITHTAHCLYSHHLS